MSQLLVIRLPLALRREKGETRVFPTSAREVSGSIGDHSRSGIVSSPGIIAELFTARISVRDTSLTPRVS